MTGEVYTKFQIIITWKKLNTSVRPPSHVHYNWRENTNYTTKTQK